MKKNQFEIECDRCEKIAIKNPKELTFMQPYGQIRSPMKLDLCADCCKALEIFLNMRDENNDEDYSYPENW